MFFCEKSTRKKICVCEGDITDRVSWSVIQLTGLFFISLECYADGGMSSLGSLGVIFFGLIFLASVLSLFLSYYIYNKDRSNNKVVCLIPLIILILALVYIWS